MPVGRWSSRAHAGTGSDWDEAWDEPRVVSRDVCPGAFMEELCAPAGGYRRFFWTLLLHYFGWWAAIVAVPAVFLDHHKCEVNLPYFAWLLYTMTVLAMLVMAVLLELSVVQTLGLLRRGELLNMLKEKRWQLPLIGTLLWKLDAYTDVAFIFIARDCGSSLWWASLATFVFGIVFGQLLFNTCFACTDCDKELPASFGYVLLDFKLVNTAIKQKLPFDPDVSNLPVARPVTLRTTKHIVGMEKLVGDIAQVSIQVCFLHSAKTANSFVIFSVLVGIAHGALTLALVLHGCMQDEWAAQARDVQMGTALLPGTQLASCPNLALGTDTAASLGPASLTPDWGEQQKHLAPQQRTLGGDRSYGSAPAAAGGRRPSGPGGSSSAAPSPTAIGHHSRIEIPDLL